MSKPITKELWEAIEKEMEGFFFDIRFAYKGHEVTVSRVKESESKTCLQVYIDDVIKGAWATKDSDDRPVIISDVWKMCRKHLYSPAKKKKMIKSFGKRRVKELFPNLDEVMEFHIPNFSKASVLCRQYKKLEGIELIKASCLKEKANEY